MKKLTAFLIALLISDSLFAQGVLFQFKHKTGDSASYVSTVLEDVLVNGQYNHTAQIINRISSQITDVDSDGTAEIHATYMTTENSTSYAGSIHWGEEFSSIFKRNVRGEMEIGDEYFMPTVRNVPVFPDFPVQPGQSWTASGSEAEDLRNTFGVEKPFHVPFQATYKYLRDETKEDGTILNVISVTYTFYFESPETYITSTMLPASTIGNSRETIFWDNQKGIIDHYEESFKIIIENYAGDVFTFKGTAEAQVTEFKSINDDENLKLIEQTVSELELENVTVTKSEKGLTLSIENIQFEPDSARLLASEKLKLKKIASILMRYPNDLLVTGHCAKRGTRKMQQQLSEERADAVATYLKALGVRDEYHLFTMGKGAEDPIATNATEEGRSKNRRVEITILE